MKRFIIAAMALVAMVGCNKDDDTVSVLDTTKKSVAITISNSINPTKAVTDAADQTNLACTKAEDLVFGFCDGSGKLVTALTIADATHADGVYTFHALDQKISRVYVIANGAGANKITKTNAPANYDAAHALWSTQTTDVEWDEIIVFGHSSATHAKDASGNDAFCEVGGHKYPLFEASVKVVPAHARLEVSQIACADLGGEFNKITVKSLTFAGNLTQPLGTGNAGFQFDATATPAITSLTPGAGKVWSWNIKQTTAPDLTLALTVDEGNGWTIPSGTENRSVTVVDYVAPANYTNTANTMVSGSNTIIKEFVNGEIYTLNLSFNEANIHSDMDGLCVNVDVQIANWVIVPVTPVFQ